MPFKRKITTREAPKRSSRHARTGKKKFGHYRPHSSGPGSRSKSSTSSGVQQNRG